MSRYLSKYLGEQISNWDPKPYINLYEKKKRNKNKNLQKYIELDMDCLSKTHHPANGLHVLEWPEN